MSVQVNDLTLSVNYNSKKAEDGIQKLSGALRELRGVVSGLDLNGIVRSLNGINEVRRVAANVREATSELSNAGAELRRIRDLTNELGARPVNISFTENGAVQQIDDIVDAAERGTEPIHEAGEAVEDLNDVIENAGQVGSARAVVEHVDLLGNALSRLQGPLKNTVKNMQKTTGSFVKSLPIFHKHTNAVKKLGLAFKRIIFYRAIRSIIREISQAFRDGTKNVALYSKALNGLDSNNANGAMSELATTSLYLKNSIGAAVIPILNSMIPALNALSNAIVTVVNLFNQLFSAMSGKATFTKAKKYAVDYAESLGSAGSAAKDLKNNLLGIDELNVISPDDAGGGGGAGAMDYSQMFEEAKIELPEWLDNLKNLFEKGDYEGLGKAIADLLANALRNIDWDYIKGKAGNFGKYLAEFLNGLIDPELFYEVGRTIAEALNTAIEFAYQFVTTFDWKKAGLSAAELVNGFLDNFDAEKFGKTVFEAIHGALDLVTTFFEEVDWQELGQKIMDFISNINWDQLVIDVAELGVSVLKAVKDTIKGAFTTDGKVDLDKIEVAIKAISVITAAVALTQMLAAALPALGSIGVQVAILITVAEIGFEGGKKLGEIMAENGLIPESDKYWYETFKFDTFFDTITDDWQTTIDGIIDMMTDFAHNPIIAFLSSALIGVFLGPIPAIGGLIKKIIQFVEDFDFESSKIGEIVDGIGAFFGDLGDGIALWADDVGLTISTWADDIGGFFEGLWDDIQTGWDGFWVGLSDGIYECLNGLYHGVEDFINMIIDAINSFSVDIPETPFSDAVHIGFNLSHVDFGDLPRFFAGGGFPKQGQLFVANEAGPEMIGGWGNQTAVANNDQIVAGIQSGVATAVNQTLAPYLSQIATNTGVTANKDFSVKIGDRDIARANTRGQRSMGRQLIYTV